jgi:nitrate/nitrite transporter NarK
VVEAAGWRMAMFLAAAFGALSLLALWALFREPPRTEREAGRGGAPAGLAATLAAVLSVRAFWAVLAAYMPSVWAFAALLHWLPSHLVQQFAITKEEAAFQATLWPNVGLVAGLLGGGPAGDYLARRFKAGRTSVQMAGLAVCVPALVFLGLGQRLDLLALPMFAYGFGSGMYQAHLWTTSFEVVNPAYRSTAIGLLNVVAGVFGFWVNPTIGLYEERFGNVRFPLASLSVMELVSILILAYSVCFLLPRDYRGQLRPAEETK